jgi:excinuclease ABC subunit A
LDKDRGLEDEEDGSGDPGAGAPAALVLEGWESLGKVVMVDQSPLSKTPRSNPVVYIGAFDDIRELFAQTPAARQRGLSSSAFSFNSGVGQCEHCRGAGFEKIEMQFLSDVFIRCPECQGRRYRQHILEVKLKGDAPAADGRESADSSRPRGRGQRRGLDRAETRVGPAQKVSTRRSWSIADVLESTVDEAVVFLTGLSSRPAAERAMESLKLLQEVGLGYVRLGQPLNTLSGGESQRLKLVGHLAEAGLKSAPIYRQAAWEKAVGLPDRQGAERGSEEVLFKPTVFLFDEPTTGLHFEDVRVLLGAFQRLVDAGHSLIVIEHNMDVIKCADWVIDLGPEAGEQGGRVVVQGTPETVSACEASHTGRFLRPALGQKRRAGSGKQQQGTQPTTDSPVSVF